MHLLKNFFSYILVVFTMMIAYFAYYIGIVIITDLIYVREDYLIWTMDMPRLLSFFSLILIMVLGTVTFLPMINKNAVQTYHFEWLREKRRWLGVILLIFFFVAVTNVTVVYEDRMVSFSSVNYSGTTYSYEDVVRVETGVYGQNKGLGYVASKGEPYYHVTFTDGKTIDLLTNYGADDEMGTYAPLVKVDRALVALGVNKRVDPAYFELLTYEEVYLDRFREIFGMK